LVEFWTGWGGRIGIYRNCKREKERGRERREVERGER
jgi:hypothetical protein